MNNLPDQPGPSYDASDASPFAPQPPQVEQPWRLQPPMPATPRHALNGQANMRPPEPTRTAPIASPSASFAPAAAAPLRRATAHQPLTCMERLRRRWESVQSLVCVGLDPDLERIPASVYGPDAGLLSLEEERAGVYIEGALVAFNQAIIDATADLVCAFKPNSAFYEQYGPAGYRALIRTITYIHARYPDIPVLLDAKRGDIGSTSAAYATAAFDVCGADAITLQPYLGYDALTPFIERADRGMFILCRTSNPGSDEVQGLFAGRAPEPTGNVRDPDDPTAPEPLYLQVARMVTRGWNRYDNCGLVVGATYPEELGAVRALVGDMPILVPGVGAQGGDLEGVVRLGLDSLHAGLLINLSRSVLYASAEQDFAYAARHEVMRINDEIERYRQ